MFPYQDRHFLAAARETNNPERLPEVYDRIVGERWPAFERMLDHNLKVMAERERDCDVQLAAYILANFKTIRLLWNPTNQTDVLAREIIRRLVNASGLGNDLPGPALSDAIAGGFEAADPPHFQRFPIPRAVAERFGLTWWEEDYRYWIRRLPEPVTWREYVRLYIDARLAAGAVHA